MKTALKASMSTFDLTHFNPGIQKKEDFVASFIARKNELDFFLTQLRQTTENQAAKHHLIIAPRGYGKTSLLRRICIALRDEDEYKQRYIALSFREEQHNVLSLDLFWHNCLMSLAEAREDEGASVAEVAFLDSLWAKHGPRAGFKREAQDGSEGWQVFSDYCKKIGRRPVLLIDNLDTLLAGLPPLHQWGLRTILQMADGPILFAAASRFPDDLNDSAAAFYNFFRITTLKALSNEEVMRCLAELAKLRGAKGQPVRDMLNDDPGRIAALNTMAGGNPRTLGVLYTVLESHMSDDVLAQLTAMLDTFTGWYQARTEELPMQTRAVFDALALNWDPMTAASLASVTGLDTPTVSAQLNRMEKSGYAEMVSLSKTKKTRNAYQVSERFYNIWYLMRNGSRHTRQKIRFLTIFLRSIFSRKELHGMALGRLDHGGRNAEAVLALAACVEEMDLRMRLIAMAEEHFVELGLDGDVAGMIEEIHKSTKPKRVSNKKVKPDELFALAVEKLREKDFASVEKIVLSIGKGKKQTSLYNVWMNISKVAIEEKVPFESIEFCLRQACKCNETQAFAWALLGSFLGLNKLQRLEAEECFRQAFALKGEPTQFIWKLFGLFLADDETRLPEAEAALRQAISLDANDAQTWLGLADTLQSQAHRQHDAEAAYRKALELDPKSIKAWQRLARHLLDDQNQVAEACLVAEKALALDENNPTTLQILMECKWQSKEFAEAEYYIKRIIALEGENATSLTILASVLVMQGGRNVEAISLLQKIITMPDAVSHMWRLLCGILQRQKNHAEALATLELGIQHFPAETDLLLDTIFLCALQLPMPEKAQHYAMQAAPHFNAMDANLSGTALAWANNVDFAAGWAALQTALNSGEKSIWMERKSELLQLLGYALAMGNGPQLLSLMLDANYDSQYAALYHAIAACLQGEDYLLQINPETRGAAEDFYMDIQSWQKRFLRSAPALAKG